ncbi:hypothetical protein AAC387_Pa02g1224 [Persea americana]
MRKLELVSVAMFVWLLQFATFNKVEGGDQAKPGCNDTCGNVTIKYPFGIGKTCSLRESFEVNCTNGVPTLANSNCSMAFSISEINFPNQVVLESDKIMAVHCADGYSSTSLRNVSFEFATPFVVSAVGNRFRAMGRQTEAYIADTDDGFMSLCSTQCMISSGTKKGGGLGQCQIAVPGGMSGYKYNVTDLFDYKNHECSSTCSFAVLVKEDFKFNNPKKQEVNTADRYPLVVEWEIPGTCGSNGTSSICGENASCNYTETKNASCNYTETNSGIGFHCYCKTDYEGNPYLNWPGGCQAKDKGDGKWKKPLIIAAGVLSTAMVGASLYSYGSWSKMKAIAKLTFKLLQDLHNTGDVSFPDTPVFPDTYSDVGDPSSFHFNEHDLKNAIKLYQQGQRIAIWASRRRVATANLPGHGVVEIRKYTVQERSHLPLFVKGVRTLSRTLTHANVATLLGISTRECSLIYKHFSDRTLHDSLHSSPSDRPTWEERLKIAAGTARGLAFTHSKGLYHGNVKSSNILIDEECNCKLVEFGVARVWRKNTLLKSSRGYVDQEYMNLGTNQLIASMDVYSFGVVLVELITGQDPSSKAFNRRGRRSLAMVFISAVDEGRLEEVVNHSIWAEERKEELLGVAELAKECLRQGRKERPKMQTVLNSLLNWAPKGPRPRGGRPTNATGSQPGEARNSDLQGQTEIELASAPIGFGRRSECHRDFA